MPLCSQCVKVSLSAFTDAELHKTRQPVTSSNNGKGNIKGLPLMEGTRLFQSALQCSLCALFKASLVREWSSGPDELALTSDLILLQPKFDVLGKGFPEPPSENQHHFSGFLVIANEVNGTLLKGLVRVYADQSAGQLKRPCDIIGRPKFSGLACDVTMSLLSRWLAACQQRHAICRETLSGAVVDEQSTPVLPTRVLQLDKERVRLIQPNGERGHYVTLSYCWGAPQKRPPLVTTRNTMVQNQHEINFDSLPKTYQDAITVVRRMAISYLWIDSLCIVQDDREDWLRESKKMGAIYERADFTIAPSHAADSWQGFLYHRPMKSTPVELPSFISSDEGPGVKIFAKIRDEAASDVFPEGGALNNRAWATQEWLLSRRVVFFTPAGIMWSCKYITQRETGERCFTVARNTHWKSVAEGFSDRRLTYPEDKLVALEGLRAEWGKRTEYSYVSGIWKECLPDQLLWHVCQQSEVEMTDPLSLPTWTWMHVPCGVRFLPINGAKNVCKTIEFSDGDSTVTIASKFKAIHTTSGPVDADRDGDNIAKAISADVEGLHGLDATQAWSLVTYIKEGEAISGFAIYDRERYAQDEAPHFALSLMSSVSPKDDAKEQRTGKPVPTKLRQQWVLIVRKAGKDTFERIGAGKIYGNKPWERIMIDDIKLI